jgi:hypothetical protein
VKIRAIRVQNFSTRFGNGRIQQTIAYSEIMNTNEFWTTEKIKAVASLWPLASIIFLFLVLVVALCFFLPQLRQLLNKLENLRLKMFGGELAMNQPATVPVKSVQDIENRETTSGVSKTVEKDAASPDVKKQPELELEPEIEMGLRLYEGKLDEAKKIFDKLQLETKEPEERIRHEAYYLQERFEKGDLAAQNKLHEFEERAKEAKSSMLAYVQRMDGLTVSPLLKGLQRGEGRPCGRPHLAVSH